MTVTRIDFYVLGDERGDPLRTACRLAEKAWDKGHKVYLHTGDAAQTERLNTLLWTFRAGSFVPHEMEGSAEADQVPVLIGNGDAPGHHDDVMINLATEVPLFFSRFQRVAEIIAADETAKGQGRERFRFYRDRGYTLETHNL